MTTFKQSLHSQSLLAKMSCLPWSPWAILDIRQLKIIHPNGKEETVNRALDGSTYPD
jgi:hypothetical protein